MFTEDMMTGVGFRNGSLGFPNTQYFSVLSHSPLLPQGTDLLGTPNPHLCPGLFTYIPHGELLL